MGAGAIPPFFHNDARATPWLIPTVMQSSCREIRHGIFECVAVLGGGRHGHRYFWHYRDHSRHSSSKGWAKALNVHP